MFYARIDEQQPRGEWDLSSLERRTFEQQRVSTLAERCDRLIHHAAPHADMIVLGAKCHTRDLPRRQLGADECRDRFGRGDRERSGRRQSRADRHIGRDGDAQTAARRDRLECPQLAQDARDVRRPALRQLFLPTHVCDGVVTGRDRFECPRRVRRPRSHDRGRPFRDGNRQHRTAVVVGMLADQVDATGCRRGGPRYCPKCILKEVYRGS